jgi:hypothetical protein
MAGMACIVRGRLPAEPADSAKYRPAKRFAGDFSCFWRTRSLK